MRSRIFLQACSTERGPQAWRRAAHTHPEALGIRFADEAEELTAAAEEDGQARERLGDHELVKTGLVCHHTASRDLS